ncbi:MAG: hypothetical protein KGL74_09225, partial [Elusimicrobia bacterium]|nr:hypothetical protein [Elusimicrobiota bacterium]
MLHRRFLFYAVVLGAGAALALRRAGTLAPARDPGWAALRGRTRVEGVLSAGVRRTRAGWRTMLDFDSPTGPQRAVLWL